MCHASRDDEDRQRPGIGITMKKQPLPTTELSVQFRIILTEAPTGVDYGVQEGKGPGYKTILLQRSTDKDLVFEFSVPVKKNVETDSPNFTGPLSQGPPLARFIYLDIGKAAGQSDSCWERRLKVPLAGITWSMVEKAAASSVVLEARLPGKAKDGGPSCATVQPIDGWRVCK